MPCVVHKAGHAYSSRHLMSSLISRDIPMTNIRREPYGRWMIFLFMVVPFVIGCVNGICQSFLSGCLSFFPIVVLTLSLWIFDLSLPVKDNVFQSDDKWNCQLAIGLR